MTQNLYNSNFVMKVDSSQLDIVQIVSIWGISNNGERTLVTRSPDPPDYYFPSNQFQITINGQTISIVSTSSGINIYTGTAQVQLGSVYYSADTNFVIQPNSIYTFTLAWGNYWILSSLYNTA